MYSISKNNSVKLIAGLAARIMFHASIKARVSDKLGVFRTKKPQPALLLAAVGFSFCPGPNGLVFGLGIQAGHGD